MEKIKHSNINFLNKVLKIIPLGSQTFSRSKIFFDERYSPLFNIKGNNGYIYDLNKKKYLDLISGLGAVTLGYNIKKLNNKIIPVINKGITLSLSHPYEYELSKTLTKIIPCAEMVRLGKNGTDVTSAAIRLSRFITKKNKIAVCGYHGWQDWYISKTTMNGGIPKYVSKDIKSFEFNNIKSLNNIFKKNKLAAVILEPLSYETPKNNFLEKVKNLCKKNNTILIFDEICTGFRVSLGGAQKLYSVTPDLATFGKGMANGFPISALVGKLKYMKHVEKIFYSGTFGGEILSIKACIETIKFFKKNNVIKKNISKGQKIKFELNEHLKKLKLDKLIKIDGHPTWLFMILNKRFKKQHPLIRAYIMQKLSEKKIIFLGSFNIQFLHSKKDVNYIINSFKKIFSELSLDINNLNKKTYYKVSKPLFSVRNK